MSKRRQSVPDRLLRLPEGRCPIHGIDLAGGYDLTMYEYLTPEERELNPLSEWGHFSLYRSLECPRRDCDILGLMGGGCPSVPPFFLPKYFSNLLGLPYLLNKLVSHLHNAKEKNYV